MSMRWLRLVLWEVRNALRELVPRRKIRYLIIGLLVAFELSFCAFALFMPLPEERPMNLGIVGGFLALNLMLASALAALSLSRWLDAPEKLELVAVSPLGRARGVWLMLAPALAAGCVPVSLLLFPFAVIVARRAPLTALGMALSAFVILAWGLLIAVAIASELSARWGRTRAAAALRSWGSLLSLGLLLAFRPVVRLTAPRHVVIALLMVSAALLPLVWPRVARNFFRQLQAAGPQQSVAAPRWGSPGWGRELWRTLAVRTLLAPVPPLLIALWRPQAGPAVLSLALVMVVMVPLGQLLGQEWQTPERLRLAPRGAVYRLRLIGVCGGAALGLASVIALAVGWGRWTWLAVLIVGASLVLPACMTERRALRGAGQVLASLIALTATVFWN